MARLLDSFGEVSNQTSIGRIKALSVLKSPLTIQTRSLFKQSNYTPDNNYDFSIEVTGQNLDSSVIRYTTDSIFTENNPSESYLLDKQSIVSSSTKTLYFPNQGRIRFEVGDTVRIRNVNNLYSELFVVTESTSNSISYSSNNLLPEISGTFIDSGTTLYKFQTYNKNTATTSSTNLFTSIMAPGKRGVSTATPITSVPDFRNVSKVTFSSPTYKEVADLRGSISKISSVTKLINDGDRLSSTPPQQVQQFKTSLILVSDDFRNVSKVTFSSPTYKEVLDLRKFPDKLSSITKLINDGNQLSSYKVSQLEKKITKLINDGDRLSSTPGKVQQFKTPFIAPAIDSTSTLYYGRVTIILKSDGNQLSSYKPGIVKQNVRGFVNDFEVSRSNYVTKYKATSFAEVQFYAIPNKILIRLNAIDVNTKVNSLNIPINEFPNNIRKVNIIASNTLQSTVSTTTAPINARENLYYANLARGLRRGAEYNGTSSFEVIDKNYNFGKFLINLTALPNYQTANISANIRQSSVSTTTSPRNARENLYYAILAPGLRIGAVYNTTSFYDVINANLDAANISAIITQSSVSTTTAPRNARENLYYATLAPGLRIGAVYNTTSSYINIGNQDLIANISANIRQSSVSTTTAPRNARENLYYATLAPGLRIGALYNGTSAYVSSENIQIRNINVFETKPIHRDLPIQFISEKLSFYSPFDNLNLSEISIEVTGQNLDSSVIRYTIDSIFIENNPNESYLWDKQSIVSSSTKTLYFPIQFNQKFFAGDFVKIRNSNSGYIDYVYVTSATNNSITYTSSDLLPEISGTFVESGSTVYSKLLSTTIGPNPLRNLNISIATPGKNSTKSFGYGSYYAASTLEVVRSYNIAKQIQSVIDPTAIKKAPIQFWS